MKKPMYLFLILLSVTPNISRALGFARCGEPLDGNPFLRPLIVGHPSHYAQSFVIGVPEVAAGIASNLHIPKSQNVRIITAQEFGEESSSRYICLVKDGSQREDLGGCVFHPQAMKEFKFYYKDGTVYAAPEGLIRKASISITKDATNQKVIAIGTFELSANPANEISFRAEYSLTTCSIFPYQPL